MHLETDVAEAYGLGGKPFWLVVVVLFLIVLARSHGTYWLARGVARGASGLGTAQVGARRGAAARARVHAWAASPAGRRASEALHRAGPVAVTLAYLTVGAQTAVFAAAGLARMSYVRFLVASIPGCVAWAFVWGTVGLGAVWGSVTLAARSPWLLAAVVALVSATVLVQARRRRAARRTDEHAGQLTVTGRGATDGA